MSSSCYLWFENERSFESQKKGLCISMLKIAISQIMRDQEPKT